MSDDFDSIDFFRTKDLYEDPYPYFDDLRAQCPVTKEPYSDVYMVTGYDEAIAAYHDQETFSNCISAIGPFAKFPVPLEGDDITEIIETYRDSSLRRPAPGVRSAQAHGPARSADAPDHAQAAEGERGVHGRLADARSTRSTTRGECEYISQYAGPYTLLVIADLLGVPEEDHAQFLEKLMPRTPLDEDQPAVVPLGPVHDLHRGAPTRAP